MNLSIRHWLAERHITINQIKEFSIGQLAGIAYRIVQDMEVKSLMPFDICTLAEVLELPLEAVQQEITITALLTESLLRSLSQKKALKRNEGTWLAFQIAYLQALQQIINQEENLQRTWLNRAMIPSQAPIIVKEGINKRTLQDAQLQALLKTLNPGKLSDTQAEQALSVVADSLLVQQMNNATIAWFIANGAEELEAKLLTQRLTHALPGQLLTVVAQNAPPLAQLQKFFRLGTLSNPPNPEVSLTVGDKIDLYRENYRANLLQSLSTPLLMESFALKDIYVPLVGVPVEPSNSQAVDLKTWVQEQLTDLETITVIESEPGYGKTSFCQMWATQVARELYPSWMPVIIRLRDIKYGKNLIETLDSALPLNFRANFVNWLEQEHSRCLLILDGLDELPPASQGKRAKAIFIQQLLKFQSEKRHKIVLTSRSKTLLEINLDIPLQLRRIAIQPLEAEDLKKWFQQWAIVQSLPIAQNFFTFLKQAGLFAGKSKLSQLYFLVRQPLMLYLLGILHRDGLLDNDLLQLADQQTTDSTLLWEIYDRLNLWLLSYPQIGGIKTMLLRSGAAHIHRTQEAVSNLLCNRHPQDLLEQVQAIALKILHSDRHQVTLSGEFNINTLPAFYFRTWEEQARNQHSLLKAEFSHPKLGEYLCGEAIANQLKILTQRQDNIYGTLTFLLDSPSEVAQHLYNLLGYGILTQEILEMAIATLRQQHNSGFSWKILLQRLESFWHTYSQSRWLDEGIVHTNLNYFHTLKNPISVEQINANTGINVFLILSSGYPEIKATFSPCGNPDNLTEFYPEAILMLIAKAAVLPNSNFTNLIHTHSLAGINLSKASLLQVILTGVNLEQTNLSEAALMGANLTGANLSGANLSGANLSGANLTDVDLHTVNLTNACLHNAILAESDREVAKLNGALFSLEQFQTIKTLLSKQSFVNVLNTTNDTNIWSDNTANIGLIESLEGQPILPIDLHDDEVEDETIFRHNHAE